MARSTHQKLALRRELRDVIFRLCSAAGVVAGMLWALNHPYRGTAQACKAKTTDAMGKCMNDTVLSSIMPYTLAMSVV